jgi:hypothetical protein
MARLRVVIPKGSIVLLVAGVSAVVTGCGASGTAAGPTSASMLQISAYLTAAATVFGVLLTVAVQAITTATQRRHERIARTFEIRLELYAKVRHAISDWSEQYRAARQLKSEMETNAKQFEDEFTAVMAKIEDFPSNNSDSPGAVFDQPATTTQGAAKQLLKEVEDCRARRAASLEKRRTVAADHIEKLYAARDELLELRHKVALLAGKSVDEALADVLEKVLNDTEPNKLDFDKFDRAAKKELGV